MQFSSKTGIQCDENLEDGLERVRIAKCDLDGHRRLLQSFVDGLYEAKLVCVKAHGYEAEWDKIKYEESKR